MYKIFRYAYILAQRKLRFAFRLRISKRFEISFRLDLNEEAALIADAPSPGKHGEGSVISMQS